MNQPANADSPVNQSASPAPRRFAPRLVPSLAALVMIVVTFSLGQWQTRRAAEKDLIETQAGVRSRDAALGLPDAPVPAESLDLRRIAVRGEFIPALTIYLDNKVHNKQAGYHVLTAFQPENGAAVVFVNRGWIAVGLNRATLPAVANPPARLMLQGVARAYPKAVYELQAAAVQPSSATPAPAAAQVWQNITYARAEAYLQRPLHPVILQQDTDTADGLVRAWPPATAQAGLGSDKHRGYAFQWYSLAALLAFLWLFLSFRRL